MGRKETSLLHYCSAKEKSTTASAARTLVLQTDTEHAYGRGMPALHSPLAFLSTPTPRGAHACLFHTHLLRNSDTHRKVCRLLVSKMSGISEKENNSHPLGLLVIVSLIITHTTW